MAVAALIVFSVWAGTTTIQGSERLVVKIWECGPAIEFTDGRTIGDSCYEASGYDGGAAIRDGDQMRFPTLSARESRPWRFAGLPDEAFTVDLVILGVSPTVTRVVIDGNHDLRRIGTNEYGNVEWMTPVELDARLRGIDVYLVESVWNAVPTPDGPRHVARSGFPAGLS